MLSKRTKFGSYTAVMAVIVLAVLVVINLIVLSAPSEYTKLDATEKQLYSLSDTTTDALSKIDEDINIYLLCSGGEDNSGDTVNNLPFLSVFIERYAEKNKNISFEIVDPIENPSFSGKYTDDSLLNYTLIVESAKRHRIVNFEELYYYYNDTYGAVPSSQYQNFVNYVYYYTGSYPELELRFDGENLITSALDYVTTDKIPMLYALEGHGETALSENLKASIENDNMLISSLSLLTSDIPEDAEGIIINAPTSDINTDEAEMISEFLADGGKLIINTDYTTLELPNLMRVLAEYGLSPIGGIVVEGDSSLHYNNYPHFLLPNASTSSELTASLAGSAKIFMPFAHGISTSDTLPEGVTVSPLFSSSEKAYTISKTAETLEKTDSSLEGPFDLAVHAEDSESGADIVWVAAPVFSDETDAVTGANQKYFISMLGGVIERDRIIYNIPAGEAGASYLVVNEAQAALWSAIFVVLIPLAFAIAGVAAWLIRRKK